MEDVNFPLDQIQVTTALRGIQEARDDSSRPRRLEDSGDDLRNPGEAEDEDVEQTARAERTVLREDRVEVREQVQRQEQTQRQGQTVADAFAEDQEVEIQETAEVEEQEGVAEENLQPLEVAREFGIDPRGGVPSAAEQVTDGFRSGNDVADPNRINEFQNGSQIDSVEEGVERANEEVVTAEPENTAAPLEGTPSIRDVAEGGGAGFQSREGLEESFNTDPPAPEEAAREDLQGNRVAVVDARVQERVQEDRDIEEEARVRNEPALDTPAPDIDPVEPPDEPLRDAIDNNPLRGPRPSEIRDDDASSVETERGQNISNLI
jgi:hypothetical protein